MSNKESMSSSDPLTEQETKSKNIDNLIKNIKWDNVDKKIMDKHLLKCKLSADILLKFLYDNKDKEKLSYKFPKNTFYKDCEYTYRKRLQETHFNLTVSNLYSFRNSKDYIEKHNGMVNLWCCIINGKYYNKMHNVDIQIYDDK